MKEVAAIILEAIKLPIKYVLWIAIAAGILLFIPPTWSSVIRVDQFVVDYGNIIGLVFVGSSSLVIFNVLTWLWDNIQYKNAKKKFIKDITSAIENLNYNENLVLREFFIHNQDTLRLPIDQPIVAGLIDSGILTVVSNIGRPSRAGVLFPVKISPEVYKLLSPIQFGIPLGQPTEADIEHIRSTRPEFLRRIDQQGGFW